MIRDVNSVNTSSGPNSSRPSSSIWPHRSGPSADPGSHRRSQDVTICLYPSTLYPSALWESVILEGADDSFTQTFRLGLAEDLANNALNVSREGEGWLVIVTHWCPIIPTD